MRRLCFLALTALALSAWAAPKRPAASLGNAKDEDPAPSGPPTASYAASCPDDDTALARALVWAFEPAPLEIRVIAVEDLALLGDARALNPLAQLIFDPQPEVQAAAVHAVSQFAVPRAEEILSNVVRHPVLSDRLKLQAISALVFQRTLTARATLASIVTGAPYNPGLRSAARASLDDWGPPP